MKSSGILCNQESSGNPETYTGRFRTNVAEVRPTS